MNKNDIYSHLANGGDPQVLLDAFLKEINEAEQKVKAETEMKKKAEAEAAAKRAAEKETKAKKEDARNAAVAALMSYLALVFPDKTQEELEMYAKVNVDGAVQGIKWTDNIRVVRDGNIVKVDMGNMSLLDFFK